MVNLWLKKLRFQSPYVCYMRYRRENPKGFGENPNSRLTLSCELYLTPSQVSNPEKAQGTSFTTKAFGDILVEGALQSGYVSFLCELGTPYVGS